MICDGNKIRIKNKIRKTKPKKTDIRKTKSKKTKTEMMIENEIKAVIDPRKRKSVGWNAPSKLNNKSATGEL